MLWGEWQSGLCGAKKLRPDRGRLFNEARTARQAIPGEQTPSRLGGTLMVCDLGDEGVAVAEHRSLCVPLVNPAKGLGEPGQAKSANGYTGE